MMQAKPPFDVLCIQGHRADSLNAFYPEPGSIIVFLTMPGRITATVVDTATTLDGLLIRLEVPRRRNPTLLILPEAQRTGDKVAVYAYDGVEGPINLGRQI